MPKLPVVSGKALVRALAQTGFSEVRKAGSHVLLEHPDGRITVVSVHGNTELPKGTLRSILRDMKITPDELRELL